MWVGAHHAHATSKIAINAAAFCQNKLKMYSRKDSRQNYHVEKLIVSEPYLGAVIIELCQDRNTEKWRSLLFFIPVLLDGSASTIVEVSISNLGVVYLDISVSPLVTA